MFSSYRYYIQQNASKLCGPKLSINLKWKKNLKKSHFVSLNTEHTLFTI